MNYKELNQQLGNVDLYLLDQILKGRFAGKTKVLDAGCGEGRNLSYFCKNGYEVFGLDTNPTAIKMASMIHNSVPKMNWHVGSVDHIPFENEYFDAIVSSAVLHFVKDESEFDNAFTEHLRVLKRGGVFFIRMASDMGLTTIDPDQQFTYLLPVSKITSMRNKYSLELLEPIKSVVVEQKRSMLVLMLRKGQREIGAPSEV